MTYLSWKKEDGATSGLAFSLIFCHVSAFSHFTSHQPPANLQPIFLSRRRTSIRPPSFIALISPQPEAPLQIETKFASSATWAQLQDGLSLPPFLDSTPRNSSLCLGIDVLSTSDPSRSRRDGLARNQRSRRIRPDGRGSSPVPFRYPQERRQRRLCITHCCTLCMPRITTSRNEPRVPVVESGESSRRVQGAHMESRTGYNFYPARSKNSC
jgi:hypothetical protein